MTADYTAIRVTEENNVIAHGWEMSKVKDVTVIVHLQGELNDGEVGLFNLNGKQLIKRYKKGKSVTLIEPEKEPITITSADNLIILGRVVQSRISLN